MLSIVSCGEKYYTVEENIEIVNHSSSRVAGSFIMGLNSFDLVPGESYSVVINAHFKDKDPDSSQISVAGPAALTVDGKLYTLKSTAPAYGFFELYGWVKTPCDKGFNLKLELTDEGIARILSYADLSE